MDYSPEVIQFLWSLDPADAFDTVISGAGPREGMAALLAAGVLSPPEAGHPAWVDESPLPVDLLKVFQLSSDPGMSYGRVARVLAGLGYDQANAYHWMTSHLSRKGITPNILRALATSAITGVTEWGEAPAKGGFGLRRAFSQGYGKSGRFT